MLLYPSVDALNEQVPNRYLLVNVVARKAREMADEAEELGEILDEKPVTLAINEVSDGKVEVDPEDLYNALNADEEILMPIAKTVDFAHVDGDDFDGEDAEEAMLEE